ncbi:MAG: hypothetical protein JWQ63_303 [Mucilaginibacter sp.]|jgi:hypothetical protein|nr:hypothetical protein [Mucilaginibacter sp.]
MREIHSNISAHYIQEGDQFTTKSLSVYTLLAGFVIGNLIVCSLFYLVYLIF